MSKCPYCGNEIDEASKVCNFCNQDLELDCPYCLQKISVFEKICPHCTSNLTRKRRNPGSIEYILVLNYVLLILMVAISILLSISQTIHIDFWEKYLSARLDVVDYGMDMCKFVVFFCVPSFVMLAKKYKTRIAIYSIISFALLGVANIVFVIFNFVF